MTNELSDMLRLYQLVEGAFGVWRSRPNLNVYSIWCNILTSDYVTK